MNINDVSTKIVLPFTQIAARVNGLYEFISVVSLFNSELVRKPDGEDGPAYILWNGVSRAILCDFLQNDAENIDKMNRAYVSNGGVICKNTDNSLYSLTEELFDLQYPTYKQSLYPVEEENLSPNSSELPVSGKLVLDYETQKVPCKYMGISYMEENCPEELVQGESGSETEAY